MPCDDELVDFSVGRGVGGVFVDELSPDTLNQIEVAMKKFDNAGEVANHVVEDAVAGGSNFKKVANEVGSVVAAVPGVENEVADLSKTQVVVGREVPLVNAENVKDVILKVALDASNNVMCGDGKDDLASAFEKSSHDDMKDAGVVTFSSFFFVRLHVFFLIFFSYFHGFDNYPNLLLLYIVYF